MKRREDGWIFEPKYETMPKEKLEKLQANGYPDQENRYGENGEAHGEATGRQ